MDLTKVIDIYSLQNLPEGEHCIKEYEINADTGWVTNSALGLL